MSDFRKLRERFSQPEEQTVEQKFCSRLPGRSAEVCRAAADLGFDGTRSGDVLDSVDGGRRSVGDMDLVEFAPDMGPTRNFSDGSRCVKLLEGGISVRLENALQLREMLAWALALAVRGVGEPYSRSGRVAGGPIITQIRLDLSGARHEAL